MRLGDLDALKRELLRLGFFPAIVKSAIERMPSIDAKPVVHGLWMFKHNPITDPKKYFIRIVCSECNLHTGQKSNYCPQCGAQMDGGIEDG